jgi:protein phosphatase
MILAASFKHLTAASATDIGKVRDHNEDACLVDLKQGLFVVSDGMGGAQAGALASEIVVKVLPRMIKDRMAKLENPAEREIRLSLRDAIMELSHRLCNESKNQIGLKGMGATIVLVMIQSWRAYIAHMGDSRAYLFREGRLKRLTEDHSIVEMLLRHGDITLQEAKKHPARGRLSRFIGMEGEVYPNVRKLALKPEDRLLLCSDGLSGMLTNRAISGLLRKHFDPQTACQKLVDTANAAGGKDNITVVIVACRDSADR